MSGDKGDVNGEVDAEILSSPNGLFNFPPGSVIVEDADEEILELYMNLATTGDNDETDKGGLGFLDSAQSILDIELVLTPPPKLDTSFSTNGPSSTGKRTRIKEFKGPKGAQEVRISVQVQQDLTALKGRKGDTGSVLWRSSLHLARHLLAQHHFPPLNPLLDLYKLRSARVLELGAGTGLLALLLAPLCAEYTASDRLENLKLVKRNLDLNTVSSSDKGSTDIGSKTKRKASGKLASGDTTPHPNRVLLEEIDWVEVSAQRKREESRSPKARTVVIRSPVTSPSVNASQRETWLNQGMEAEESRSRSSYDLVLAVDCIYNESLVQPLVDTLAKYCQPGGQTVVWVVVELRSSDVLTMFLDKWINDPNGPWTIMRLGPQAMGDWEGTRPRWVGWVGWR